ncbi:hypothetical protein GWI33_001067 [Rhynchophorus ferrugineus]|uniref:Uncharacterized protein n=1 Tax=Rhynchophorus ferrugineus TaxID=354439 RepID=A0A834HKG0_RHYFE|nr:hypothetical protein GWI33_003478 [Rhynchophorus ferrugineus]KAF7263825.1 hypothetical protein GWI33_001067 [Rhynchophorus ferrugineus]
MDTSSTGPVVKNDETDKNNSTLMTLDEEGGSSRGGTKAPRPNGARIGPEKWCIIGARGAAGGPMVRSCNSP